MSVLRMTFCMLLKSDRHFTGFAVAVDPQQGVAGFQIDVAGQGCGIFACRAGAQLATQALAAVHEWDRGIGG